MANPAIWKQRFYGGKNPFAALMGGTKKQRAPAFDSASIARLRGGGPGQTQGQPQASGNPAGGILSDYLNQQRADFGAEGVADRAGMINAIRRYVISYGQLPDFSQIGGLGGDAQGFFAEALDQNTRDLAAKAEAEGVSSHARLSRANETTRRRIPAALAARGMLRSGQTGVDLGEQAQTYKNQGYDMLNEMLSGITGTVGSYQENERQRQRALAEAAMNAAMQASQDWGDYDMGGGGDEGAPSGGPASLGGVPRGGGRGRYPITRQQFKQPRMRKNWLAARGRAGRM